MFGKSGAGFTRRKTSVRSFLATTPGSACEFTYAAIAGAVPFTLAKPSQYAFMPTIVLVK
jgi:hypothetical protein